MLYLRETQRGRKLVQKLHIAETTKLNVLFWRTGESFTQVVMGLEI